MIWVFVLKVLQWQTHFVFFMYDLGSSSSRCSEDKQFLCEDNLGFFLFPVQWRQTVSLRRQSGFFPLPGAVKTNSFFAKTIWVFSSSRCSEDKQFLCEDNLGVFLFQVQWRQTVSLRRQSGVFPLPGANTLFFLSSQVQSGFFLFLVQQWQTQFLCEDSLGFFLFQVQRWQSGGFPVPDANTLFFLSSQVQSGFCLFQVRSRCWAAQLYRRCTARWGRPSCGSAPLQVRRQLWRSSPSGTGATPSLTTRWEKPRKQRAGRVR